MRASISLAVGAVCLTTLGCARGPEVAPVMGRVTYGGKPVAEGMIMFCPADGRAAVAPIEADGSYRLTTFAPGDGALLGTHTVTIDARRSLGQPRMPRTWEEEQALFKGENLPGKNLVGFEWIVPEKFSLPESSCLTRDVARGDNVFDFDLPREAAKAK